MAYRVSGLLRIVLIVHGLVTLAAAVVLAVLPAAIPATVGIELEPDAYMLSYFLAAAELAIAMLSLGATRLTDPAAVVSRLEGELPAAVAGASARP